MAFKSALTEKVKNEALFLLNEPKMTKPATKSVSQMLNKLKLDEKKVLFVVDAKATNLYKSIKNLALATVKKDSQVSTLDIVGAQYVILLESTLASLRKVYQ